MSNYTISWEVAGEVQLSRSFSRLALELTDFREPLGQVADEVIYPELSHQFDSEGDPEWPALSPGYARWKARHYPDAPKLVASGALRRSLTDRDAPGAIYALDAEQLTIGTDLRTPNDKWNLGLIHQLGAPNANIPARPMFRLRPSAQTAAVTIFSHWFARIGRREGVGV